MEKAEEIIQPRASPPDQDQDQDTTNAELGSPDGHQYVSGLRLGLLIMGIILDAS